MVTDPIKFVYLVGDGVTTDFSYAYNGTVGFDADVAEDVKAAILNPDGTRDTNPNFAVMQDTYGNFIGKIRFAVAPVANAIIYIYRATPQTQETEYKTSSGFDAQNVEKDFDKLTKLAQETASHTRNKTLQLDMFQEAVLKLILTSSENQNQMLFIDFENLTFKFTDFTKGQTVITPAAGSDDKTDLMLRHQTDNETGSVYLAFSIDQGKTWNPMNFAEIKRIVDEANENAAQALENSEQAVDTANEAKDNSETAVSTSNDAKAIAQNAATDAENAVQTATNATDIANAANATAESAKTTATNASTKADAAVSTANSALQKANTAMVQSSDALADAAVSLENSEQAVATANAAKNTADGIDGKATNALANSEQAVSTANDAKAVADGIDAKAQEALDNSETAVSTANDAKQATAGKADKATTLAGYGITDAYTKTEVDAKVSSVYRFRGSVATYANLPTTGQVVGDVWNVEDTGANYAWSGSEWDKLSETVDLTPYLTKADAARTYATITTVNGKQDTLTTEQLAAVNSGITSAKVASYDAYAGEISVAKTTADKADNAAEVAQQTANLAGQEAAQALSGLAGKVNVAQGTANAGKLLGVGDDGNVVPVDGASGTGRNIGDIFWTTRTDSALNGAVEANGAQYNFADVNGGANNVQTLLTSGALPSVSIAKFDAMVAEQGGCDSFGYDSGATYFKVPKKLGRVLVRSQKPTEDNDYNWFNVYSDGWVEQGGCELSGAGAKRVDLLVFMATTNYTTFITTYATEVQQNSPAISIISATAIGLAKPNTTAYWEVKGYADRAEYTPDKWDYQNVQVERPMVQLFNSATDEAVAKCTEVLSDVAGLKLATDGMIDYVVEKQEPTSGNGYTWYRKYKSGWVEQGGICPSLGYTVTFPVVMADVNYTALGTARNTSGNYAIRIQNVATTGMKLNSSSSDDHQIWWQVSGMSAQGA